MGKTLAYPAADTFCESGGASRKRKAWAPRLIRTTIVALLLAVELLAIGRAILPPPPERRAAAEFTAEEKRWIEARFKYHGIWACVHDESGYYFYRDGQKCRL